MPTMPEIVAEMSAKRSAAELNAALSRVKAAGFVVPTPAEAGRLAAPGSCAPAGEAARADPADSQWLAAIKRAEQLRLDHNGIGGVYLYFGHDGDNKCVLKDGGAKEVGTANSGRSMLEAIERAEKDWRSRKPLKVGDEVVTVMPPHGAKVVRVTANTLIVEWDLPDAEGVVPGTGRAQLALPIGSVRRAASDSDGSRAFKAAEADLKKPPFTFAPGDRVALRCDAQVMPVLSVGDGWVLCRREVPGTWLATRTSEVKYAPEQLVLVSRPTA